MDEGQDEKGFQDLLEDVVKITDKSDDEILTQEIESKSGELEYLRDIDLSQSEKNNIKK